MRIFAITLAGAIGGAALAVAIVFTLAAQGQMPINDRQMQTYMMTHPELALAMIGRQQQLDDMKKQAQQVAASDSTMLAPGDLVKVAVNVSAVANGLAAAPAVPTNAITTGSLQ